MYWSNAFINLQVNPRTVSSLSETQVSNLFKTSLNKWTSAGADVSYGYNQSSSNPAEAGYDDTSRLFFSSQSAGGLSPGVIAVTQVTYYLDNGEIIEADLIFNDQHFEFTANLGDTGTSAGSKTKIYLPDVATHEIGHAFGLDHSTNNFSTMIYTAFSGQHQLTNDDNVAINTLYPRPGSSASKGSISGSAQGLNGGMFGTHIVAVNLANGEIAGSTLANSDGSFVITDIPAGDYTVYAEAFRTSTSTISSYWSRINHRFCGGSRFRTTFYHDCSDTSGLATTINVRSGNSTNIGTISPSCSAISNENGSPTSAATARAVDGRGGAYYGNLPSGRTHFYKLESFAGNLNVRAASFSLYSPIDVNVVITNSVGAVVGTFTNDIENPRSGGYINYDSAANASGLPLDTYYVQVTANSVVSSSLYPAGYDLRKDNSFYLLSIGANNSYGVASITDMSSCRSINNTVQNEFTIEFSGERSSGNGSQFSSQDDGAGCGMIARDDEPPFYNNSILTILVLSLLIKLFFSLPLAIDPRSR